MNPEEIANKILNNEIVPINFDGHHAEGIAKILCEHGAKPAKRYSSCKVATYENRLKLPDGREVALINSSFMGRFTEVEVYSK